MRTKDKSEDTFNGLYRILKDTVRLIDMKSESRKGAPMKNCKRRIILFYAPFPTNSYHRLVFHV